MQSGKRTEWKWEQGGRGGRRGAESLGVFLFLLIPPIEEEDTDAEEDRCDKCL